MLDKKHIQVIFWFEFKMGCKAAVKTHNINNASGPETDNQCTVQWWFKKFCLGDKNLEDEENSGRPLEVDNNQLKAIIKAHPTTWEVAEELSVDHSPVIWHLKQIGMVKKTITGCLMSWPQIKNIIILKCCLLLFYATTTNHFSTVWKVDFFIGQLATTNSVVGPRRSSKAFPKAKFAPKTGYGHWLVVCCQSDPLQLSESWQKHYIWEASSANQWDAPRVQCLQLALVNRKGSILLQENTQQHVPQQMLQKLNKLG